MGINNELSRRSGPLKGDACPRYGYLRRSMSEQPKKSFFKMPENFADATDEEIDALAQSIIEILYAEKKKSD